MSSEAEGRPSQTPGASRGGKAVWSGEVQKLTVNGGLVSTLLGSKFSLDGVDFNQALYLEITVDAQAVGQAGNGVIDAADPPLFRIHIHSTIQMIGDNAIDGVDSTVRHSGEHHNAPRDTGNAGGSETRPNNAYVNYIIKC